MLVPILAVVIQDETVGLPAAVGIGALILGLVLITLSP